MKKLFQNVSRKKSRQISFLKKISEIVGVDYKACNPPAYPVIGGEWYIFIFENITFRIGFSDGEYYFTPGSISNRAFLDKRPESFTSFKTMRKRRIILELRKAKIILQEVSGNQEQGVENKKEKRFYRYFREVFTEDTSDAFAIDPDACENKERHSFFSTMYFFLFSYFFFILALIFAWNTEGWFILPSLKGEGLFILPSVIGLLFFSYFTWLTLIENVEFDFERKEANPVYFSKARMRWQLLLMLFIVIYTVAMGFKFEFRIFTLLLFLLFFASWIFFAVREKFKKPEACALLDRNSFERGLGSTLLLFVVLVVGLVAFRNYFPTASGWLYYSLAVLSIVIVLIGLLLLLFYLEGNVRTNKPRGEKKRAAFVWRILYITLVRISIPVLILWEVILFTG